ncbi:DUF459 domain-containing protein [Tepidamorphus sp. 3E244]|uniref:SGNH/GDSL hydrolase family protein n=1 Tax=Tepidamorphus sp. 3E244 TaxID=3385498 RepID=UPI0038FCB20C
MTRYLRLIAFFAACIATATVMLAAPVPARAQAQGEIQLAQVDPLANFFRGIFGGRKRVLRRQQRQPQRDYNPRPRRSEPAPPKVVVEPKDDDARVVWVFGDSIAASLAQGLEEAFAEDPSVKITGISETNSGLVRYDHHDWQQVITEKLEDPETRMDMAVLAVGINDRQRFRLEEGRVEFGTPEWGEKYEKRLRDLIELFYERRVPVIWVGLPPTTSSKMNKDFLAFNARYRQAVEEYGGSFVDIWTNFLDENERYSSYGPDVTGRKRLLRRKDGINYSRAGGRKLAFYVEKQIKRVIGAGGIASLPGISTRRTGPDPRETGIGYVFDLTGPLAADNGRLAGGPDDEPLRNDQTSAYQKVLVEGASMPVVGGVHIDGDPLAGGDAPATDDTAQDDTSGEPARVTQ